MKISLDPVIASRIRKAWARLPADMRARLMPMLTGAHLQALAVSRTRKAPPPDPRISHLALFAQSALTQDQDRVLDSLEAGIVIDVGAGGEIWGTGKYQQLDPGWAESIAVWLEHLILGKHAFNSTPPAPIQIPDSITIAIAGDWGTGDWRTSANPAPSTNVRTHLAALGADITIHLGDVYYAGTDDEESHLLLDLWPRGSIGSLTLNSNHEMYPGATPYFSNVLTSGLFALQQKCSFFVLENANWVIVGLDSAYYSNEERLYMDGSLAPGTGAPVQIDFLRAQAAKGKRVMVLTHHNALTEDGTTETELWTQVMSAFPAGTGPAYWYWGHAHAGAVYKPYGTSKVHCRCCGHGALPWGHASDLANSAQVLWYENRSARDPDIPQRVFNGYAVLDFNGPTLTETFYDERGLAAWPSASA